MGSVDNSGNDHVQRMFDRIAGRYDLLNRVISFRLDAWWRKKAVSAVIKSGNEKILDLGTGTGDLTFAAGKSLRAEPKLQQNRVSSGKRTHAAISRSCFRWRYGWIRIA
jgi:ubiquinone/menaquinone biosynthesis C-methylase UbiE